MSAIPTLNPDDDLPVTRSSLIERFHSYGAPRDRWLIGGEFERILLWGDGRALAFDEPNGVRWILSELVRRFGWAPREEDGHLIELRRNGASTTLEPGGQIELSGAPHERLLALQQEAQTSFDELQEIIAGLDLHMIALGLTPTTKIRDIPWVPKGRYRVMRDYLGETGDLAHAMMKGTSSFQANFDFADEADCAKKVSALSRLGPLTTAMFANSPFYEGSLSDYTSFRGHIWTRTDPARTGFPEALREDYTHERWVDNLLDVPMMFYLKEGRWAEARGRTFREYMEKGLDGHFPRTMDWELHLTSVFPEVRVKRTIEVRGADACPLPIAIGGIALWTGLIYDDVALDEANTLAAELSRSGTLQSRFETACRHGLSGEVGGRTLAAWARDLTEIGARGLSRARPDERHLLAPVEALVAGGESLGQRLRRAAEGGLSGRDLLLSARY
jgi:glutamate--cysteine ligase